MAKIYTFSLILISILITFNADAQKEDHRWIIGYNFRPQPDTTFGHTSFDFNYDPVKIYHDSIITTNFADVNSSLSDPDGNLLACTNGQILMNGMGRYIEDTINYDHDLPFDCRDWEYNNGGDYTSALPLGMLGGPRAILLPMENKSYAIYSSFDRCIEIVYKLSYSEFIINNEYPSGMMVLRDIPILLDSFSGSMQAVRHGNGRDWWLVTLSRDFNWLFTFLVDEQGIAFHSRVRTVVGERTGGLSQICFSPDGNYLSFHFWAEFTDTGHKFVVYDFDRCSGSVSNPRSKILPFEPEAPGVGIAFSYDSRYLYASTGMYIRQYDMLAEDVIGSEVIVVKFDGFTYQRFEHSIKYPVSFHRMKLAPDGRIYIIPPSASQRYISVIHYPHSVANEVYVAQHSIFTPRVFSRTVPNMPDYRLGPLDGSPCDTLGIDNHPVAKFRYEADTLDHLRLRFTDLSYFRPEAWSWDFGDGSPASAERYPQHLYAKSGTYEVCLTVSNENSSDTNCRTVTIGGTNPTDETAPAVSDVSLFPNPVSDFLLITLGEYIPAHGTVSIHDLTGKKLLSRRLYHGHNTLDMSNLPSGLYLCVLADGAQHIRTMKVVKE